MRLDLANPKVDPVEYLNNFLVDNAHYLNHNIKSFDAIDLYDWIGRKYRIWLCEDDAIALIKIWRAGGLIVRNSNKESASDDWGSDGLLLDGYVVWDVVEKSLHPPPQ